MKDLKEVLRPLTPLASTFILFIIPIFSPSQFILNVLILAQIYVIFVVSWDFLAGYTGMISIGHAFFFGAAAYTAAIATAIFDLNPWFGFLLPLLLAAAAGISAGLIAARLSGPYLALGTLAIAEVAHQISLSSGFVTSGGSAVGGEGGVSVKSIIPLNIPNSYDLQYYLTLILMLASLALIHLLGHSNFGLKLKALREDEVAAELVGIDTLRYKMLSILLSAIFAGLAGSLYAHYLGRASPTAFSIELSFTAVILSTIGGRGSIFASALAAYLFIGLFEWLALPPITRLFVLSILFILAVRFMPEGMLGIFQRLKVSS